MLLRKLHVQSISAQTIDNFHILLVIEISDDTLRYHIAYTVNLKELVKGSIGEAVHILEMACKKTRCSLADKAYAEGKDHTFKRYFLAVIDAFHHFLRRHNTVFITRCYLLRSKFIQVGKIMYQPSVVVIINGLSTECHDIHGLTCNEMLYTPLYLRRATCLVRTIMGSLAFITYQFCTALRTACDKPHRLCIGTAA